MNGTPFSDVYNRFLGKITDDLYVELTPEDTIRDLQNLLIDNIPGFEFPRKNLYDYTISVITIPNQDSIMDGDFVLGGGKDASELKVDRSKFNVSLTPEEINILAILMMQAWVQRQVTSIEHTRMKYTGADFKMTSQANHLSKLLAVLNDCKTNSIHMQRLYKRRKVAEDGTYISNWSSIMEKTVLG